MVALVILNLAAIGYLQLLHASHVLVARSREQAQAVAYATAGIERVKLELPRLNLEPAELLPGDFRRQVVARHWRSGLALLTVTVSLPDGARFELSRLVQEPPEFNPDTTARQEKR
jgi:hypothetical protein